MARLGATMIAVAALPVAHSTPAAGTGAPGWVAELPFLDTTDAEVDTSRERVIIAGDDRLITVDAAGQPGLHLDVPAPRDLLMDGNTLWVIQGVGPKLLDVDPATLTVRRSIDLPKGIKPFRLLHTGSRLTFGYRRAYGPSGVGVVDPTTHRSELLDMGEDLIDLVSTTPDQVVTCHSASLQPTTLRLVSIAGPRPELLLSRTTTGYATCELAYFPDQQLITAGYRVFEPTSLAEQDQPLTADFDSATFTGGVLVPYGSARPVGNYLPVGGRLARLWPVSQVRWAQSDSVVYSLAGASAQTGPTLSRLPKVDTAYELPRWSIGQRPPTLAAVDTPRPDIDPGILQDPASGRNFTYDQGMIVAREAGRYLPRQRRRRRNARRGDPQRGALHRSRSRAAVGTDRPADPGDHVGDDAAGVRQQTVPTLVDT